MTDYTELKRLATCIVEVQTSQDVPISKLFDDFDAATSPEVVLALIAENERLERLALDSVNAEYAGSMDLESICAERDQLRAEVAGLRTGCEAYERVNAELKAECEALRGVMSAVVSEIPGARISRAGNAPGHCHSIPGVWDEDNGSKAGKECAWCKVWNYAAAMGKGEQS